MGKSKIAVHEAKDDDLLSRMQGIGPSTLCALANAGFKFTPKSTLADFKRATESLDTLKVTLENAQIKGGYTLPKLKNLWSTSTNDNNKRAREVEMPPPPAKRVEMDIKEPESNFFLGPKGDAADPEISNKDEVYPQLSALNREETHVEKAIPTGDITGKVCLSVVPDVTLQVAMDDRSIANPSEVLPEMPVSILPGAAIGPLIAGVRHVEPVTHEERMMKNNEQKLSEVTANGGGDIGSDGKGNAILENAILEDKREGEQQQQQQQQSGGSKFTSKPLDIVKPKEVSEDATVKPFDIREYTYHPYKQASLFRDHDAMAKVSQLIEKTKSERQRINTASRLAELNRNDLSYSRYNAATQGVRAVEVPDANLNFLDRSVGMITDFELHGAHPLLPIYSPCPYVSEKLLGRFV